MTFWIAGCSLKPRFLQSAIRNPKSAISSSLADHVVPRFAFDPFPLEHCDRFTTIAPMRKNGIVLAGLWVAVALGMMPGGSRAAGAEQTFELRDGRWQSVAPADAGKTPVVTDEALDRAEQLLSRKQYEPARKITLRWLKTNKTHPLRDRALFLLAEAYEQYGNRILSFYYLDELMDNFPESRLFYPALDRQYQIADDFLNGYKRRLLYMSILSAEDEAIEMLYRIQGRSPGSPLAEKALLRTADYYYADSQFDFAGDAYASYVKSYPRSPAVPRVRLRQAFSALAQFRGLKFDATPIVDARAQLVDIGREYPDLAREQNTDQIVRQIDEAFARKIFTTADFYRRTHYDNAAVYNYRLLKGTYPDSPEAARADEALKKMPARALQEPAPPRASGFLPTTQSGEPFIPIGK